jgi:hypothetical protein
MASSYLVKATTLYMKKRNFSNEINTKIAYICDLRCKTILGVNPFYS